MISVILFALALPARANATDHFIVQCDYSHSLNDDPIVFPGMSGASHTHDFVGNTTTNAFSTYSNMLNQPSTCGAPNNDDTAGYWMPAIWKDNTRYLPDYARIYYARDAPAGVHVIAPPAGAELIGGSKTATGPSPGIVSFSCGANTPGDTNLSGQAPYDCTPYLGGDDSRDGLVGRIIFPHCWDGTGLTPTDFTGNTATCPKGTQYMLRLRVSFHYNILGATPSNITFGTQPGELTWYQNHADFFNTWNQTALQAETTKCINTQPNSCLTFFGKKVGDSGTPTP